MTSIHIFNPVWEPLDSHHTVSVITQPSQNDQQRSDYYAMSITWRPSRSGYLILAIWQWQSLFPLYILSITLDFYMVTIIQWWALRDYHSRDMRKWTYYTDYPAVTIIWQPSLRCQPTIISISWPPHRDYHKVSIIQWKSIGGYHIVFITNLSSYCDHKRVPITQCP